MPVFPQDRLAADPLTAATPMAGGAEWIIDARGCDAALLCDAARLEAVFDRFIDVLRLTPVAPAVWHRFPAPGGLTGFVILAESHLACHTFPEFGSICVNVFCCRPRDEFDAASLMTEMLGATETVVRLVARSYKPVEPVQG